MGNDKINVIPTKEEISAANNLISDKEKAAEDEMNRRTQLQLEERNRVLREQELRVSNNNNDLMVVGPEVINIPRPQEKKVINTPYDLIPLPSEGLLYPSKKSRIKVAYLNASDENILTSPHLLESGEFLDILLDRKIIDEDISPKDLHVGDRNAIMVWLRATAYGNIYPVQVINPYTGELIETDIDLSTIKTKKLGVKPDKDGYFDFKLPVSGKECKLRLLTVRDVDAITIQRDFELVTLKKQYADSLTYTLEKEIVEIDGNRDREYIKEFISIMRVGDSRAIRKYIDKIESGLDMNVEIQVPGGEPFTTFLPINISFFWPEL
jgi:hypothetical protein